MRPGGIIRVTVPNKRYIELLATARRVVKQDYKIPLFDDRPDLPQLGSRAPRKKDLQGTSMALCNTSITMANPIPLHITDSRELLLGCDDPNIEELKISTVFYSLNEYTNFLFHPQVRGFSFEDIGEMIEASGLKLVGWELPELLTEDLLKYKVETGDTKMQNYSALDQFQKRHPEAFKNTANVIGFTVEKL